jgi:arylsulfatase A-like enzyme
MEGAGPYFLVLNFMDAHDPYFTGDVWQWETLGNDPQRYRARYEPSYRAAIRNIDRQLAAIVARAGRGAVIAVVSDHGEHFGERNLVRHGNSLYPELLRVPLFVRIPGRPAGRVPEPFSLADLPTLLPPAPPAPAQPVTASLIQPASFQRPREVSVVRGAWQLIARDNGQEEVIGAGPIPPPLLAELRAEAARVRQAMEASRETSFRSLGYVQ